MRDLTIQELDNQLAEQLPARELMGSCWHPCGSTFSHGGNTTTVNQGSYDGNGNGNGNVGLINVAGIGNGDLDGNTINLGL